MKQASVLVRIFALLAPVAFAAGSRTPKKEPAPMEDSSEPSPPAVAREYLVKFKTEEGAARRAQLFAKHQVKERSKVGSDRLYLIEIPASADEKATVKALEGESDVKYIEANMIMRIMPVKKAAPN